MSMADPPRAPRPPRLVPAVSPMSTYAEDFLEFLPLPNAPVPHPMNMADPARVPRPPRLVPTIQPVSTYEEDLLEFLHQLSLDEMVHIQTYSTTRTRAGYPLSDYDIAMNDLLQQAIDMAVFDQDRALAQQITGRGDLGTGRTLMQGQGSEPLPNHDDTSTIVHDCVVCQKPVHGSVILAPCGHHYGIDCLADLFQHAVRDETLFPPRCCGHHIPFDQVQPHLSQELVSIFEQKQAEFSTLQRVYCSSPTCSRFLGPLSENIDHVYACPAPRCATQTCARCRSNCTGDQGHVCGPDAGTTQVLKLGHAAGWAQCPGCSQLIERQQGCNHMTCRCRTDFCYACSARWKTCACPQYGTHRIAEPIEGLWFPEVAEGMDDWPLPRPAVRQAGSVATPGPANRAPARAARVRHGIRPTTQHVPAAVPANRTQPDLPATGRNARTRIPPPVPTPAQARPRATLRPPAVEPPVPAPATATPTSRPAANAPSRRGAGRRGNTAARGATAPAPASTSALGSGSRARARLMQVLSTSTPARRPASVGPRNQPMRPRLVRWGI